MTATGWPRPACSPQVGAAKHMIAPFSGAATASREGDLPVYLDCSSHKRVPFADEHRPRSVDDRIGHKRAAPRVQQAEVVLAKNQTRTWSTPSCPWLVFTHLTPDSHCPCNPCHHQASRNQASVLGCGAWLRHSNHHSTAPRCWRPKRNPWAQVHISHGRYANQQREWTRSPTCRPHNQRRDSCHPRTHRSHSRSKEKLCFFWITEIHNKNFGPIFQFQKSQKIPWPGYLWKVS